MAREASGDEETVDAGDRTKQGKLVGRERLEPGPALGERAARQTREDLASDLQASLHAVVEHFLVIRLMIPDPCRPAAADEVGAISQLLEAELPVETAHDRLKRARRRLGPQHLERPGLQRKADAEARKEGGGPDAGG